jgi:nitrate/nitrite transport system ATP-binding protein
VLIQAKNLSFGYTDKLIIQDLNFDLAPSEVTAFLGVSGCGKSTLIKLLAGLQTPTSGSVIYKTDKGEIALEKNVRKSVIFQDSTLFPWKTVAQNIALARTIDAPSVEELAQVVGVSHALAYFPSELSGGMTQRVEFARVLAAKPQILFMDEPFNQLDIQYRRHLQDIFKHVQTVSNPMAMFVTHDIREAIKVAKHIKVLIGNPVQKLIEYSTHEGDIENIILEVEKALEKDFELRRVI